jgi:hypothetical protein
MFAMADEPLPRELQLGKPAPAPRGASEVDVRVRVFDQDLRAMLPYQRGELVFHWGEGSLGLRMGIHWKNELHWWEWVRVETLWSGPLVKAVRAGGYIEASPVHEKEFRNKKTFFGSQRLHKHDWVYAEVFALCFANGVVQVCARHINNHRFDEGRDLKDVLPVIGLLPDEPTRMDEAWDGSREEFALGSASMNLEDAAPLVSAQHPGRLHTEKDMVVFQPYEGVEVAGGQFRGGRKDGFCVRAFQRILPKGVARTVRFRFGLGEAAPVISRLVAPEWWHALCGDLWPDGVLPVRNELDARIDRTYEACVHERRGRFDDNVVAWSWEGETPYSQLLYSYRSGDNEHWRRAIRDAYHIADIAFDHSTETIRMTDYPFDGSIAPPLFRTAGLTVGHLETGDPYLLECAESATSHWYWIDRHNWPRFAFGRDGGSLRSLIFLWDYTGKEDYLTMAREAIGRLIQCQLPDGSYNDQGGTVGVHSIGQVVKKPWMANLATDPVLDYLLRGHDEPALWRAVEKAGGFMMSSFVRGEEKDYWPYQTEYGGTRFDPWIRFRAPKTGGKLPTQWPFAHGHKARLLNVLTRRTGEAKHFETWLRFFEKHWAHSEPHRGDYHVFNKTLQHLPFAQAHCWNARWRDGSVRIDPIALPSHPEMRATVVTPVGDVHLVVRRDGKKVRIIEQSGAAVKVETR